jgi:hypothetical protein
MFRTRYVSERLHAEWLAEHLSLAANETDSVIAKVEIDLKANHGKWAMEMGEGGVGRNNVLITQCLVACARQHLAWMEEKFKKLPAAEEFADSIRKVFDVLPQKVSLHNFAQSLKLPSPGMMYGGEVPAKDMVEPSANMRALQALGAEMQPKFIAFNSQAQDVHGTFKGRLNEKNYAKQLEDASEDEQQFSYLVRSQQQQRANYESARAGAKYAYMLFDQHAEAFCDAFNKVRAEQIPADTAEKLRFQTNCILSYWNLDTFVETARKEYARLHEDQTQGEGYPPRMHTQVVRDRAKVQMDETQRKEAIHRWSKKSGRTAWAEDGELIWLQLGQAPRTV